jgi:hypothetical protein
MAKFDNVLRRALALAARPNERVMELAKCVTILQESAPDEWQEFLRRSGMGRRKAYYLIQIAQRFNDVSVADARLNQIGWTKLEVISTHLGENELEELLALAETHTVAQLRSIIDGNKPPTKTRCVKMYLTPEQYGDFEKAILLNGGRRRGRGLQDKVAAMTRIVEKVLSAETAPHPRPSRSK